MANSIKDNATGANTAPGDLAAQIAEIQDQIGKLIKDRDELQDIVEDRSNRLEKAEAALGERDERIAALEAAQNTTAAETERSVNDIGDRLNRLESAPGADIDTARVFRETDALRTALEYVRDNGFRNMPLDPKEVPEEKPVEPTPADENNSV